MEFGEVLRELRKKKGLTQEQLGKKLGVSKAMINHYESGKRSPSYVMEEAIADFFSVSIDTLRARDIDHHYYTNPETAEKAQELFENRDMRLLFDAAKDSRPEDLQMAAEMLRRLKATNPDG